MKKWSMLFLLVSVVGFVESCGTSEQGCAEQCAMSFSKTNTLCRAKHGSFSSDGNDCSKLALQENDQCAAGCYGK